MTATKTTAERHDGAVRADRAERADRAARAQADPVLTIEDFSVDYLGERVTHAVKHVSLTLGRGEILGLAGESGCGKSTLAYGVNRLLKPPAKIVSGRAVFHSREGTAFDLGLLEGEDLRAFRWDRISMVFQGAMNSLNPVITVQAQLEDIFRTHRPEMGRKERRERSGDLLERVGVDRSRLRSFAHELSGGMRQRVMIAMAMALGPQVMIMDEPTTALDVVVQREILREITRLREELGFAVVFITHDLPLLLEISDRIAVMREGEIVELGDAVDLYTNPQDDYTKQLLASFPSLTGARGDFIRTGEDATTTGTTSATAPPARATPTATATATEENR
ncbi:ABC transporter ATP-binding protein [Curtobacterium sp. ISL-83]|uniref:ABC transporter ATP-binding protein n=1 Tax=Curtobacterium sp. ISL-83 TaxID=2819145 RepID=UPI001BE5436B|nr:ABC transporter ATP-binding protein [Curtobacterium sp. ISL-83]MBT2501121.1 ABC transporter ATP-binding protein [Curtobacterium sp. ISL-83]